MGSQERLLADFRGTALTLGPHPMALRRKDPDLRGVCTAADLPHLPDGQKVRVAGGVIVRQRPSTARGVFFISLEDETGIANLVIRPRLFERERLLLVSQPFLLVEGRLQNRNNVTSVRVHKLWPLQGIQPDVSSHDFR